MAKLNELLSERELGLLPRFCLTDGGIEIKYLTVEQLSYISFVLIRSDRNGIVNGFLSAVALELLLERAKKKNLQVF